MKQNFSRDEVLVIVSSLSASIISSLRSLYLINLKEDSFYSYNLSECKNRIELLCSILDQSISDVFKRYLFDYPEYSNILNEMYPDIFNEIYLDMTDK